MSGRLLQLNFKFHVSRREYEAAVAPLADPIADMPGLHWKVWLMNEAEQEAGGIYLFENAAALDAFLATDLAAGVMKHPALSDFSVKRFDPIPALSAVTRAPLAHPVATD